MDGVQPGVPHTVHAALGAAARAGVRAPRCVFAGTSCSRAISMLRSLWRSGGPPLPNSLSCQEWPLEDVLQRGRACAGSIACASQGWR